MTEPVLYRVFGLEGEYDRQAMKELIRRGDVTSLTDVTLAGSDEWKSAGMYPELQHYLSLTQRPAAITPQDHAANSKQIIIATILIAGGLFFGVPGVVELYRGFASMGWPAATEAQLLQAEVVRRTTSSRRGRYRRRSRYELHATYRYLVDGRRYLGDTVSFGNEWFASANEQLTEAQRGPFRVYYKPGLPRIAVMRRGPTAGAATNALTGMAGVVAGALMLFKPQLAAGLKKRIQSGVRRP